MAKRKKAKQRRELLMGVSVLSVTLAVLLIIAVSLAGDRQSPSLETEPAEPLETVPPTLPPPETNPYGPMDFQYEGKYLTCIAGDSTLGIDVSAYQGDIDWEQVAASPVEFVMIRLGYRGYESGWIQADDYARANYEGARAAGLKVGVYFFSQAVNEWEAVEEASFVLSAIRDWELDLPVVYDWEYVKEEARTGQMNARQVTDCTLAFCRAIEARGYEAMVYFNTHQADEHLVIEEVTEYPFWLAMYTDRMTYDYKVRMWQYTDRGQIPGIEGYVDLNLWFRYPEQ